MRRSAALNVCVRQDDDSRPLHTAIADDFAPPSSSDDPAMAAACDGGWLRQHLR
jgi:hypothetical protein